MSTTKAKKRLVTMKMIRFLLSLPKQQRKQILRNY